MRPSFGSNLPQIVTHICQKAIFKHALVKDHGIELTKETLLHSDQGCHYTSTSFIRLINDNDLRQSMSRKGNCWDNAPQESFFGHMKDEIDVSGCTKYREVKRIIDDWMSYYNNERYQWQLAKLSPNEYYQYIMTGFYPLRGVIKEPGRKEGDSGRGEAEPKEESKDDKTQGEAGEEI